MGRIVGVDVSKARLDARRLGDGQRPAQVASDGAGVADLATWAGQGALAVMEASGGHGRRAQRFLAEREPPAAIVNPKRVRDFEGERSAGQDGPCRRRGDRALRGLRPPGGDAGAGRGPPRTRRAVGVPAAARRRDHGPQAAARAPRGTHAATPCRGRPRRLRRDKVEIEALLRRAIAAAAPLARTFGLLTSAPGVGLVLAATLPAELPELGRLDRRKIASLAGLAPVARDSGLTRGRRVVAGGRGGVRRVPYMAAVAASQRSSRSARFCRRLVAAGEPKKLALVATMREMLTTLNAMARGGTPWREQALDQAA